MIRTALALTLALVAGTAGAGTSTLVSSCADGPDVGAVSLPLAFPTHLLSGADFNTTACGGTFGVPDAVFCFTPANSCTVAINSTWAPVRGGTQWLSVFSGGCVTAPAGCVAANSGSSSASIPNLAVTGGVSYCVVVQDSIIPRNVIVSMSEVSGSCGALPVELTSLSLD